MKNIKVPKDIVDKWQNIVDLMAKIIGVPAGLIMKINVPYIEVYRSSKTKKNPYKVGNKEHLEGSGLYCETVIKTKKKLLVPNALKDKDWNKNPDIKLGMISYLGFPILWPDGKPFGTICVLDLKENKYNKTYEDLMVQFKQLIEVHLGLLYDKSKLEELIKERNIELKESEIILRNVFEAGKDALFLVDLKTNKIINCNKQAEILSGYTSNEIKEIKLEKILPSGMVKGLPKGFDKKSQGKLPSVEVELTTKNNKKILILLNIFPIEISKEMYLFSTARDISEKKELEKNLKKRIEQLEKFQELTVGRELKMIELKKEIRKLKNNKKSKKANN